MYVHYVDPESYRAVTKMVKCVDVEHVYAASILDKDAESIGIVMET